MPNQPTPVCSTLCGSLSPDNQTICLSTCESIANCALTPNILYTFINGLATNSYKVLSGVGNIIKNKISSLAFRLAIYQQIPWLLGFLILMIALVVTKTIYLATAILLFFVVILIAVLFIYISLTNTANTLINAFNEVRQRVVTNFNNSKDQIALNIENDLFDAWIASKVAC